MAEHNEIGKIGENVAKSFLVKQGFSVVERNYRTKYGEIDIIAKKDGKLRFVEVKSIKVRSFENLDRFAIAPEDNLTREKWRKLLITLRIYLSHHNVSEIVPWCVDLACVYVDTEKRIGKVKFLENVTVE